MSTQQPKFSMEQEIAEALAAVTAIDGRSNDAKTLAAVHEALTHIPNGPANGWAGHAVQIRPSSAAPASRAV